MSVLEQLRASEAADKQASADRLTALAEGVVSETLDVAEVRKQLKALGASTAALEKRCEYVRRKNDLDAKESAAADARIRKAEALAELEAARAVLTAAEERYNEVARPWRIALGECDSAFLSAAGIDSLRIALEREFGLLPTPNRTAKPSSLGGWDRG